MTHPIVFVFDTPYSNSSIFSGPGKQILGNLLGELDIEIKDVEFLSLSKVARSSKQKISVSEAREMSGELLESLQNLEPRVVVLCGAASIMAITGGKGPQMSHGEKHYDERLQCVCIHSFHPMTAYYDTDILRDIRMDLRLLHTYVRGVDSTVLPKLPWKLVETEAQFKEMYDRFWDLVMKPFLGTLDIETTGLNFRENRILSVGISFSEEENYIVTDQCMKDNLERAKHMLEFVDEDVDWVGQNLYQFDFKFVKHHYGINWNGTIDTMLAHYTLDERQSGHGLKYLAQQYFGNKDWSEKIDWDDAENFTEEYLKESIYPYQVYDLYYTRKLVDEISRDIRAQGDRLSDLHYDVLIPGARALGKMEMNGIGLDLAYMDKLDAEITAKFEEGLKEIQEKASEYGIEKFNPNSPKQVKELLLEKLKLKASAGSGTDKEALASMDHPIANLVSEIRLQSRLKTTYVTGLKSRVHSDSRIRGDFVIWGTSTGRLSARNPNMQNIPSVMGPLVKRAFVPTNEDFEIVNIDYSQLELRVAGWLSGDDYLFDAYENNRDIHTLVAASMYQISPDEVTKLQRYHAKYVDFGVLYGRQAKSLAEVELKCEIAVAQRFIDNFLADFDKLNDWIKSQHEFVREHQYTETAFGRRRRFPLIHSGNISEIERQAVNSPIQGTASDITFTALSRIADSLAAGGLEEVIKPVATVHDSLVFDVHKDYVQQLIQLSHYEMVENVPLERRIRFDIDVEVGTNYGDVKGIDFVELLTPYQRKYRVDPTPRS